MSILTKPYEITVWEDVYIDGSLQEQRLGVIGSDKMIAQCRVQEPNLVRNVNGVKKLTFKMYKRYVDNITGQMVNNPFCDWLVSERKVKLKYGTYVDNNGEEKPKWYDFVVKDIVENSSNYLYTYSLEDALVQELSKNGFGVTLDAELMNNVGDATSLGEYVLEDTDWTVSGETFVQTVDEALIYLSLPSADGLKDLQMYRLKDQVAPYTQGVVEELLNDAEKAAMAGKTILAFYSCCKNKPHRFQFIYYDNGADDDNDYGKNIDGTYKITRKDDRTIIQENCQYYIDFDDPETNYVTATSQAIASLDLFIPEGFGDGAVGVWRPDISETARESDSILSSWYRGRRYGFAQQSVYVPLLERYCQKFRRQKTIQITESTFQLHYEATNNGPGIVKNSNGTYTKNSPYSGLKFVLDYENLDEYVLAYQIKIIDGTLKSIGGHNASFDTKFSFYNSNGEDLANGTSSSVYVLQSEVTTGTYQIVAKYTKKASENIKDGSPYIFIQPNRGYSDSVTFEITKLKLTLEGDYLGYTESEFVSPTLIQNCINNYKFESTAGWTATAQTGQTSKEKANVQNVYGRFDETLKKFIPITDDFYNGTYTDDITYTPYMQLQFYHANQFILNSGIHDNRAMIVEMPKDEKWILDYKIVDDEGNPDNDAFTFSLGEYIYNTDTGGYNQRNGYISFSISTPDSSEEPPSGYARKIITVTNSQYTKETFKKNSKIYLKISPNNFSENTTTVEGDTVYNPQTWYVESIALYKKSLDKDGNIIVPDYEQEDSQSAEEYINSGTTQKKYHYFHVSETENASITNADQLQTSVRDDLNYVEYKPQYNEGAKKIRSVTAKESNYFNILQSIAETFECWLDLEVIRDSITGAVQEKIVKFKNYIGADNYANFRYGVNLKDIQRTYSSKNIATKLIVKQNSNELAEGGFCTIQRAGANPTGENYIYDFQYYLNQGIMNTEDYLGTVYYMDGAKGPDAELWDNNLVSQPASSDTDKYNLNGYYARIKKINEAILSINEEIIGHNIDLIQKKAEFEVATATKEASASGIEITAEDFLALTGVYPEEAQTGEIDSVALQNENSYKQGSTIEKQQPGIVTNEDWWQIAPNDIQITDKKITATIVISEYEENCAISVKADQGATVEELEGKAGYSMTKSSEWTGLYIEEQWDTDDRVYTLEYDIKFTGGSIENIGCHNGYFDKNFSITVKDQSGETVASANNSVCALGSNIQQNEKYHVIVRGTCYDSKSIYSKDLWIQPNRASATEVSCEITDIKLTKTITSEEAVKTYDRIAHFYLNVVLGVNEREIYRTYSISCKIPANATTATIEQQVTSVDTDSTNVQKYISQYVTYFEKLETSTSDIERIEPQIQSLENTIKQKTERRKTLLGYKAELNKKFFKKYSRFILEGTWINEEYVDDDKYYADAQSVLYNSCYPQVSYNINVISLKGLPGYELIDFDLGDKTKVIDPQFFGDACQEEVIVTETSEMLDDMSKNSIKVQNFKNQFQDLFQKITATVQQTQYNVGSYEKGAALVEANLEKQNKFITNAINNAQTYLNHGQTVTTGPDGITITDDSDKQNKLRMVGGAILFSAINPETQETTWMTGITKDGISASLITAGRLDTGAVQIMSGDTPVFRWDVYGISAYDALWNRTDAGNVISGINKNRFVRFDKNGIYGINNVPGIAGDVWYPSDNDPAATAAQQIDTNATFALTWEGLKVTGENGVVARLGKLNGNILNIMDASNNSLMSFSNDGKLTVGGWWVSQDGLENGGIPESVGAMKSRAEKPEVFLTSTPRIKSINSWFNDGENHNANVVFKAGEHFMVTDQGELYAKAGKIGNVTIGKLASMDDVDVIQTEINDTKNLITSVQTNLQDQIDGAISSWFETGKPGPMKNSDGTGYTEASMPASAWIEEDEKHKDDEDYIPNSEQIKHEGDLYYDKEGGQCYRWVCDRNGEAHGTHYWTLIQDNAIADALAAANEAQETADGKMTVYGGNSLPDGANDGDLLIPTATFTSSNITYKQSKVYKYNKPQSGTGSWVEINYTDQDTLNAVKTELEGSITAITNEISNPNGIFVDGIEKVVTSGYINQFDLQASSLIVYDKDNSYEENGVTKYRTIFSAQASKDKDGKPENGAISLAGWTVTSKQLTAGTIGDANSFGIYPQGINSGLSTNFKGVLPTNDTWIMTAGKNFGVTKNGFLCASSGKIGNLTITEINNVPGQISSAQSAANSANSKIDNLEIGGCNLVYYTAQSSGLIQAAGITMNSGNSTYSHRWNITVADTYGGFFINNSIFKVDQIYTLSYKFKKTGGTLQNIGGHMSEYEQQAFFVDGEKVNQQYSSGYSLQDDTAEHTVVVVVKYKDNQTPTKPIYIQPNRGTSTSITCDIWDIKVEEGNVATAWTPAPEETDGKLNQKASLSVNTNNFSWKFDSSKGFYMYNGAQSTSNEVFKIYKPSEKAPYEAWLKGHVVANSGKIGSLEIIKGQGFIPTYLSLATETYDASDSNNSGALNSGVIQLTGKTTSSTTYTSRFSPDRVYLGKYLDNGSTGYSIKIEADGIRFSDNAGVNSESGSYKGRIGMLDLDSLNITGLTLADERKESTLYLIAGSALTGGYRNGTISMNAGEITFKTTAGTVNVSALVFKGPYDIKLQAKSGNWHVVGHIWGMGNIYYGYFLPANERDNNNRAYGSEYFSKTAKIYNGNTEISLPGPYSGISVLWTNYDWFDPTFGSDHADCEIVVNFTKDTSGNLQITTASGRSDSSLSEKKSYFHYGTNSTYHHA